MNTKLRLLIFVPAMLMIVIACGGSGDSDVAKTGSTPSHTPEATIISHYTQPKESQSVQKAKSYDSPPEMTIDPNKNYTATFEMEKGGQFIVELYPKEAPKTVNSFIFLARDGFYNGVTFHRVIIGFMAQGGDPTGTGTGGPGYRFENEVSPLRRHDTPGTLSMANAGGEATNGSQFFITFVPTPMLDGVEADGTPKNCAQSGVSCHTVFGRVISGMDVVYEIAPRDPGGMPSPPGDAIQTITIQEVD